MSQIDLFQELLGDPLADARAAMGEPLASILLPAEAARDAAIARVAVSHESFVAAVVDRIRSLPSGRSFTTDDVWLAIDAGSLPRPREPRALGAAMVAARRAGMIVASGSYRKSVRAECHARPVCVWSRS